MDMDDLFAQVMVKLGESFRKTGDRFFARRDPQQHAEDNTLEACAPTEEIGHG
jgi:hypothetical protein